MDFIVPPPAAVPYVLKMLNLPSTYLVTAPLQILAGISFLRPLDGQHPGRNQLAPLYH